MMKASDSFPLLPGVTSPRPTTTFEPQRDSSGEPRFDVLGVRISAVSMQTTVETVRRWINDRASTYVCVTGVHGVMESRTDPALTRIHNHSGLTVADGTPLLWCGRWLGLGEVMSRVRGPDLMLNVCELAAREQWPIFLFGAGPGVADQLSARLRATYPGLIVAGTFSPPFRAMSDIEDEELMEAIRRSGARIVWVGLSTPKQERWMAAHVGVIPHCVLLGVGAAFDIHAKGLPQAPIWMQRAGLEWLYRLIREPRRLARRYLSNNPRFVAAILRHPPNLRQG
jgi:N-acetylglucosaminyldiphosphoundecaprenol N-acetyl-beta-D-mannosaminyltransferase